MRYEDIKELIAIFEKTDLNDMEVRLDNAVVRLNRGKAVPMPMPPVLPDMVPNAAPAVSPAISSFQKPVEQKKEVLNTEGLHDITMSEPEKAPKPTGDVRYIKAPIVGTFYRSASPEKPPYVEVGSTVAKGDVVCIIEAMKFMNEVSSEESGKIVEVLVEDGEFVEFGAPLFSVE